MGGGGQIHDLLRYLDPGLKIINLWQKEEKRKTKNTSGMMFEK